VGAQSYDPDTLMAGCSSAVCHCRYTAPSQLTPNWKRGTELAARWPFYVFLVGAMVCLLASTVCHTMHCISQRFSSLIWRVRSLLTLRQCCSSQPTGTALFS